MPAPKLRHFTVEGRGTFPLDMLRYDMCWPHSEMESSTLARLEHAPTSVVRVKLTTYNTNAPTDARWRSFGWKVVPV